MRIKSIAAVACAGVLPIAMLVLHAQNTADWPAAAGDIGGMKYSPADQITPANVGKLKQAWTYQPGGPAPIVVNNLLYTVAGPNVVALNADTGVEAWTFRLSEATAGSAIRRGMTYWPGDAQNEPRVLITISSGKLVQLEAKTGKL